MSTPLTRPRRLREGDTISIVAPAGPVAEDALVSGIEILESWGLQVELGDHILDKDPTFAYLAGTDANRAADLERAWCDPGIAAVVCARGGYGSMRTLQHVDWAELTAADPKIFIGSSDVTALHAVISARLQVSTLFAPMPAMTSFATDATAQKHLQQTLFDPESMQTLVGINSEPLVGGTARGVTVGGNLSLVVSGVGVEEVGPPPEGAIALLEDYTEDPYRIDHFVTYLMRAGWFDTVGGIALGSWAKCGDLATVKDVLVDRLGRLGVPVVWEFGFGHCPAALTVPIGLEAELNADAGTLTFTQPALR